MPSNCVYVGMSALHEWTYEYWIEVFIADLCYSNAGDIFQIGFAGFLALQVRLAGSSPITILHWQVHG